MKIFKDQTTFYALLGFVMLVYGAIQAYFGLNTYALITSIGAWAVYLGMHLVNIEKEIRRIRVNSIEDMILYRDKEGKPLTLEEWCVLFNHPNYRRVKEDTVGKYIISTIWMGIWHHEGTFFETAIIDTEKKERCVIEVFRYQTLKQAEEGHVQLVESFKCNAEAVREICNG